MRVHSCAFLKKSINQTYLSRYFHEDVVLCSTSLNAQILKNDGVRVFAVGVTDEVREENIRHLTSPHGVRSRYAFWAIIVICNCNIIVTATVNL